MKNREIKFRVWNKEKKEMHKDIYLKWLSPTLKRATRNTYNDFGDVHHLQLNDALANNKDYILIGLKSSAIFTKTLNSLWTILWKKGISNIYMTK